MVNILGDDISVTIAHSSIFSLFSLMVRNYVSAQAANPKLKAVISPSVLEFR